MSYDPFRPRSEPACLLYDALVKESAKRGERSVQEWQEKELQVVLHTSNIYADKNRLPRIDIEEVKKADQSAAGHTDYMAKLALYVQEAMQAKPKCAPRPDGRCSKKCPSFFIERTPGWPPVHFCGIWIDEADGPEPGRLASSQCRPARRLLSKSA